MTEKELTSKIIDAALAPIHTAQLLTYLKFTEKRLGLLMDFNSVKIVDGIKRVVNGY